ncbi:MAG TPA: FAD-dependent oxidoreductase [Caulobacteraceae bacterium]|jgi:3-phenylpropionate/trans-cinnamate dioxygenase ferredoxin reductase subunit|nr:FAD-dependent oxidoreductase [Caulobacteraceae bacterium]
MGEETSKVVMIGAGHAAGMAAANLRQYGFAGPVTLIGEEPIPPYQRPPLSKAWLKGEADEDALTLKPESFYAEHGIDLRMGVRAEAIDRAAGRVRLSRGGDIAYDILVLATGARPRRLPIEGADLAGVRVLRSAADAEALKAELGPGRRIAVVGGGYIGLEVAASARALGAEAVVIEREARVLARVANATLSGFFQAYHEARGVGFELGAEITAFEGAGGRVAGVRLGDGRLIACDVVLVGVGAAPNDELVREAGLDCGIGVVVDEAARTSDPAIYAIGDVTLRPMPLYGRQFRPESVPSALEQAKQAACAIAGRPPPAPEVPWNWSDQYDLKMQLAGLPFNVDDVLVRGDPANAHFAVFHLSQGMIQAVEAVNAPAEFMGGRQLIGSRRVIVRERLADPSISMKEVAA